MKNYPALLLSKTLPKQRRKVFLNASKPALETSIAPESEKKEFYEQLEGLRGIAVLLVMISHFVISPSFPNLLFLKFGFIGVNLFFVLSGFLITELLLKQIYGKKTPGTILKSFYMRRTLRIFPIYYLTILVIFFLKLETSGKVLFYASTYTYNLANVWAGVHSETITHFWSLCVEEQFYLLWPLLLIVVTRRFHLQLIMALICFGIVSRLFYVGNAMAGYDKFIWSTPSCFDALGIGALLAWMKLNRLPLLRQVLKFSYLSVAIIIIFWLLAKLTGAGDGSFLFAGFGRTCIALLGFFVVGIGALNVKTYFGPVLNLRWLKFLGRISYGLYLYHWILFVAFRDRLKEWFQGIEGNFIVDKFKYNDYLFTFLVMTGLSIIVAYLSFILIERPLLKLKNKF